MTKLETINAEDLQNRKTEPLSGKLLAMKFMAMTRNIRVCLRY